MTEAAIAQNANEQEFLAALRRLPDYQWPPLKRFNLRMGNGVSFGRALELLGRDMAAAEAKANHFGADRATQG